MCKISCYLLLGVLFTPLPINPIHFIIFVCCESNFLANLRSISLNSFSFYLHAFTFIDFWYITHLTLNDSLLIAVKRSHKWTTAIKIKDPFTKYCYLVIDCNLVYGKTQL